VKLSMREKRLLIAGAAVAGAILLYYAGSILLPDATGLANTVEYRKKLLLRQRETIAREESYKAKADLYRSRLKHDMERLLPMNNPSIAGAELQKVLKELADRNGIEILRRDIQREQKLQDNIVKIPVRVETNCAPEQLVQFLVSIQNYERSLTVDQLVINSFRIQKKYEIRPAVTVSGYIEVPEEAKAEQKAAGAQQ
jgi:hypothetical protein